MKRQIIHIDEDKCVGCGLCAEACHEGAIQMVNGKAKLIRDDYCDGLGNCLPVCPTEAITFTEREAAAYDEEAVKQAQAAKAQSVPAPLPCGCPGTHARAIERQQQLSQAPVKSAPSELRQWPVQIKLAPVNAPYFAEADLLIAADCAAYAYGSFHARFMRGKVTLIGCPKLDEGDYAEKLSEILRLNDIESLSIARMEVPCCGGLERACRDAIARSGKHIPFTVITISTDGRHIDEREED